LLNTTLIHYENESLYKDGCIILNHSDFWLYRDRQEARSDVARIDPAADRWLHTANRARATTDPRVGRLVKSHFDVLHLEFTTSVDESGLLQDAESLFFHFGVVTKLILYLSCCKSQRYRPD
jgi:hypothetical protein